MFFSPINQFELVPYFVYRCCSASYYTFSNGSVSVLFIICFYLFVSYALGFGRLFVLPTRLQSCGLSVYLFLVRFISNSVSSLYVCYTGFLSSIFLMLVSSNYVGLYPYAFTLTSHPSGVFFIAFVVWFGLLLRGCFKHGLKFLGLFYPHSPVPWLIPFLVLIEFVSYIFRVISLAVRLCANMIAGHMLLKIMLTGCFLSLAVLPLSPSDTFTGFFILFSCFLIFVLEFFIAFLQAYIFVLLCCVYIREVEFLVCS